jgi:hypothetical protein
MLKRVRFNLFLFLTFIGRKVNKFCTWLAGKLYTVPISKIKESLTFKAPLFEPKRKFRWALRIDGVPEFAVCSASRPYAWAAKSAGVECDRMRVTVYDPVVPNLTNELWVWLNTHSKKNGILTVFDHTGKELDVWKYTGLKLSTVDFGSLDYSDSEPLKIYLEVEFDSVDLVRS